MDRRSRQAQATADKYFYKFISRYVEATHNELYKEALALFEQAKTDNPGVKDLVKTVTYLRKVHPEANIPRYYIRRNLKSKREPNLDNSKHMVLNIPLISVKPTCPSPAAPLPPPEIAMSTPPQLTETVQLPLPTAAELPPPEIGMSTPPQLTETVQLPLPMGTYNDLLNELQSDPELANILNDFPFDSMNASANDSVNEFTNDNVLDTDMIFWQDETSPLELEVQTMLT